MDNNGDDVGKISKQWMGCFTEVFTNTDTFKIKFPENVTLEIKAVLLGATMLVVSCWYLFIWLLMLYFVKMHRKLYF